MTSRVFDFVGEKVTNKLTIDNGRAQWQREERSHIVLNPGESVDASDNNRAWLIVENNLTILNAIERADLFLSLGDSVIITTDQPKKIVEKYEDNYQIWHEYSKLDDHRLDGLNVNCVGCDMLISDAIGAGVSDNIDYLIEYCGGIVTNAEWGKLPTAVTETAEAFPLDMLPDDLAGLVEGIARGRKVETAFVATILLGVIAQLAMESQVDDMPLIEYFLTVAGTGAGKSTIMDYLLKPMAQEQMEQYQTFLQATNDYKDRIKNKKPSEVDEPPPEKPAPLFLNQANFSIQGLLLHLYKHNVSLQNSEARTVFYSNAFSRDNRENIFGYLCTLWDGQTASYYTKEIKEDARPDARLMMNLAIQDDVFSDVIAADSSFFLSGFMPRFLTYHNPPIDHNDNSVRANFSDLFESHEINAYDKYCSRVRDLLASKPVRFTTDKELRDYSEWISTKYRTYRSDKHPDHATYRRCEVSGFLERCSQHAIKIAGILAVWQGKDNIDRGDLDRAKSIVDYYLAETVKQANIIDDKSIYNTLLTGIYRLAKDIDNNDKPYVSTALIARKKIVRDSRNTNRSIRQEELAEYLDILTESGYLKTKRKGNKTLVKIHPKYKPN